MAKNIQLYGEGLIDKIHKQTGGELTELTRRDRRKDWKINDADQIDEGHLKSVIKKHYESQGFRDADSGVGFSRDEVYEMANLTVNPEINHILFSIVRIYPK